jgi:TolA-binding protein
MTYLILEIVFYLLSALMLGLVGGWLLRGVRLRTAATTPAASTTSAAESAAESAGHEEQRRQHQAESAARHARVRELEAMLAARQQDSTRVARKLEATIGRVRELEGERALLHRAIEVLHQQLELANEWRGKRSGKGTGTNG